MKKNICQIPPNKLEKKILIYNILIKIKLIFKIEFMNLISIWQYFLNILYFEYHHLF